MAFSMVTNYVTRQEYTPTTQSNAGASFGIQWQAATGLGADIYTLYGYASPPGSGFFHGEFFSTDGNASHGFTNLQSDSYFYVQAKGSDDNKPFKYGSILNAKLYAMVAAVAVPTIPAYGSTTATIACNYTPNVNVSTCSAQLQYKKTTDPDWTNAGSAQTTGGYTQIPISRDITGLEGSTQYQVRLVISRGTLNGTSLISSTASFTTDPEAPSITTVAASVVTADGATLNASVDPNAISTDVTFEWDTDSGAPYANETSPADNFTGDGAQNVSKSISGLVASTNYFYRAKAVHAGGTVYGAELSFTTPVDPLADAAEEDHVFIREFNERKYGVESKFVFPMASPAATSSDRYFNAAAPFAAGDVQVAQDTGAGLGSFANVTNLPVRIGTSPAFELTLTAAEMAGVTVIVSVVDQDGPLFRDQMIVIRTKQELGQIDVNATQIAGNTPAMSLTGIGTSPGLIAVGGATAAGDITGRLASHVMRANTATAGGAATIDLDAGANANDDWYNESLIMITGGTGAGQARLIIDYTGSSKQCTVDSSWVTNPDNTSVFIIVPGARTWHYYRGELSAIPADNANMAAKFQLIFQRFAFKITQTATVQTLFKADNSTSLATRSVSDAAGTQTIGKLS